MRFKHVLFHGLWLNAPAALSVETRSVPSQDSPLFWLLSGLLVLAVFVIFLLLKHLRKTASSVSQPPAEITGFEDALEQSHRRYKSVLQTALDGFWMVDQYGTILETNQAYVTMSGFSKEEIVGLKISFFEVNESPEETRQRIQKIMQTGGDMFQSEHRRKDGSVWPVEVAVSYANVDGGMFFSFIRDIHDRRLHEELINMREVLNELVYQGELDDILRLALDKAEKLTNSQIGFFHFVDDDQINLSLQTWSTRTLKEMCFAEGAGLHYPVNEAGVWVDCIRERKPVLHNDYASLSHKKGLPEGHAPLLRELTVPIFRDDLIVAVIGVGNKQADYKEQDIETVTRLADIAFDFVERKRAEQSIEYMAYYDTLTGLPNRDLLADRLTQAIAQHERSSELLAVCYLDLDGFKPINDTYGHDIGDLLLKEFSRRIAEMMRNGDTIARIGGDEFVILLTSLNTPHESEEIVTRILKCANDHFEVGEHLLEVEASVGITIYPVDGSSAETLIRHADQAMYQAKQLDDANIQLYDPVEEQKMRARRDMLDQISDGIDNNEFELYFQPKVDLNNGCVIGLESLIRWNHPEKGFLTPYQFLHYLDSTPEEIKLGEWVMETAIKQLSAWQNLHKALSLSVNVSPDHILHEGFVDFVEALLQRHPDVNPANFELEILETSAIEDIDHMAEVMQACSQLGLRFSLDDFGTGYSSLTYFHHLPIDILKIDQNFVMNMMDNVSDLDIVEGVLKLSDTLKRPVVAEGVENIELALMLMYLGCHYAQGYAIAKPMPAAAFDDWQKQWQRSNFWQELRAEDLDDEHHFELKVAMFNHRRWARLLEEYVKDEPYSQKPILDHSRCQFSHWYHGIGKARYGSRPSYGFILPKHTQLHELGEKLVKLHDDNDRAQARDGLRELKLASEELNDMLILLVK